MKGETLSVVGVPDAKYGEEILACVIPRRLEIVEAFPMTVSGKVRKIELRERFAA
ncbi:hypothetical protein ABZ707_05280 [Streptomyces sp. NPDC006923]|uniref:hypothetical protein n=1 Tax=Streptomyces sp. NPDC006923 TaxID=3155355 RepID=UPI0033D0F324